uniref:Uncharacterized protein n=1 Tax=Oryza rufipogon TaxID=4529 RepID=A0A0E0P5W4_ORYRU
MSMMINNKNIFYKFKNAPNLEKVILANCKIPDNSRKSKIMARLILHGPSKRESVIMFESQDLKLIMITYKDDDISDSIELLLYSRRKLENNTTILTKH